MNTQGGRTLVIGGTGFFGRLLVRDLLTHTRPRSPSRNSLRPRGASPQAGRTPRAARVLDQGDARLVLPFHGALVISTGHHDGHLILVVVATLAHRSHAVERG
jgi:uncharacterized protein YbjT (DUF2867 family)